MTDQELKGLVAGLATSNAEMKAMFAKTDTQVAETSRAVNKMERMRGA